MPRFSVFPVYLSLGCDWGIYDLDRPQDEQKIAQCQNKLDAEMIRDALTAKQRYEAIKWGAQFGLGEEGASKFESEVDHMVQTHREWLAVQAKIKGVTNG